MREDRAVKISKKELNTLIAELDEYADLYMYTRQQEQQNEQQSVQDEIQQHVQQSPDLQKQKKRKTPDTSFEFVEMPLPEACQVMK